MESELEAFSTRLLNWGAVLRGIVDLVYLEGARPIYHKKFPCCTSVIGRLGSKSWHGLSDSSAAHGAVRSFGDQKACSYPKLYDRSCKSAYVIIKRSGHVFDQS